MIFFSIPAVFIYHIASGIPVNQPSGCYCNGATVTDTGYAGQKLVEGECLTKDQTGQFFCYVDPDAQCPNEDDDPHDDHALYKKSYIACNSQNPYEHKFESPCPKVEPSSEGFVCNYVGKCKYGREYEGDSGTCRASTVYECGNYGEKPNTYSTDECSGTSMKLRKKRQVVWWSEFSSSATTVQSIHGGDNIGDGIIRIRIDYKYTRLDGQTSEVFTCNEQKQPFLNPITPPEETAQISSIRQLGQVCQEIGIKDGSRPSICANVAIQECQCNNNGRTTCWVIDP